MTLLPLDNSLLSEPTNDTRDPTLFAQVATLGRRLINAQTFGARFGEPTNRGVNPGSARCTVAVPNGAADYPDRFFHDESAETLHVGAGEFAPVSHETMNYAVSGFEVVPSWLAYRMRKPKGKTSSALDAIRPEEWSERFTDELLEVIWTIESVLALEPELAGALERVLAAPPILGDAFPHPRDFERKPPQAAEVIDLFET